MTTIRKISITSLFTIAAMFSSMAFAQKKVYDARNYAQNYRTAIEAVKTEINTAATLRQQTLATIDAAKSVAAYKDVLNLQQAQEELRLFQQLQTVDTDMLDTLQKAKTLNENMIHTWAAGDKSFDAFLKEQAEISDQSDKSLLKQYETMTCELESVAQRRQNIATRLQDATGQTQALQAVGSSIDVLIGQNQQLISVMTAQAKASAIQKQTGEATAKQQIYNSGEYQRKLREAARQRY